MALSSTRRTRIRFRASAGRPDAARYTFGRIRPRPGIRAVTEPRLPPSPAGVHFCDSPYALSDGGPPMVRPCGDQANLAKLAGKHHQSRRAIARTRNLCDRLRTHGGIRTVDRSTEGGVTCVYTCIPQGRRVDG